jgi:hypothetical protein
MMPNAEWGWRAHMDGCLAIGGRRLAIDCEDQDTKGVTRICCNLVP